MTPTDETMKAKSVPTLHISAMTLIGVKPLMTATARPTMIVMRCGVAKCGWTLQMDCGMRPSRLMAKKARVCAYIMTSSTVVRPAMAPVPTSAEPKR